MSPRIVVKTKYFVLRPLHSPHASVVSTPMSPLRRVRML